MWVSFLVKTKAEHVFCVARDHKRMYTTIEILSVCDLEKELRFTRQGNVCCFLCRAT